MIGFVYILQDDLDKYYIGSCVDVQIRYKKHLSGAVHTTLRMKNPRVVLTQEYPTIIDAKRVERKIKKLKRKDYIAKMIKDGFIKLK